jgi:hypothetical protein
VGLTESSVVCCAEEVVSCDLAGGSALLDLRSGTYFNMNAVGAFVWEALRDPIAVSDIEKAVMDHYEVEQAECHGDLLELLEELVRGGLITVVNASPR